jgi:hypothetical protein
MIDKIVWGNPTHHARELLTKKSIFDKHIPTLVNFSFPKNSSKVTQEELNQLVDYTKEIAANPDYLNRYRFYDQSIERTFAQVISDNALTEDAVNVVDSLLDESLPLLSKLKYHFQRPRPYQLAKEYKLRLFPYESPTSNSPSFPSGHTFQSSLICYVLGNHYPDKYEYFDKLARDIEQSRLYLGLHYPSDNDFSLYCVERITKDKDFIDKYNL